MSPRSMCQSIKVRIGCYKEELLVDTVGAIIVGKAANCWRISIAGCICCENTRCSVMNLFGRVVRNHLLKQLFYCCLLLLLIFVAIFEALWCQWTELTNLPLHTNGVFGGVDRRIGIGIGILICASIIHSCQIL